MPECQSLAPASAGQQLICHIQPTNLVALQLIRTTIVLKPIARELAISTSLPRAMVDRYLTVSVSSHNKLLLGMIVSDDVGSGGN